MEFQPLELAVLAKLLDGASPALAALRTQMTVASVKRRELTGVGFYTEFSIDSGAPRAPVPTGRISFGDVDAAIEGLRAGAGFVLFVEDGILSLLEGYSYDEPWPNDVRRFSLKYRDPLRKEILRSLRAC